MVNAASGSMSVPPADALWANHHDMDMINRINRFSSRHPRIMANDKKRQSERPISNAYPLIDTDLARDNIENDQPAAELEDL